MIKNKKQKKIHEMLDRSVELPPPSPIKKLRTSTYRPSAGMHCALCGNVVVVIVLVVDKEIKE